MMNTVAGDSASPILEVQSISAGYGRIEVLHEVSLKVFPGEIVSIIGCNGAGKTTTLLAISGLRELSSGRIVFAGGDLTKIPAHERVKRGLAQVPEGRKIFPRLTVLENLRMGAYLRSDHEAIERELEQLYLLFPVLKQRLNQQGGTLSGGEQQMLAIARALMSRPKLLLMDEPSMGVAPMLVARIFETLKELNRTGLTILLVEQNAHLALKLSSRAYVIETGSIILEDSAAEVLSNPKVREAYLGE